MDIPRSIYTVLAICSAAFFVFPIETNCQSLEPVLSREDEAILDSVALRTSQKIKKANLGEKFLKVLVIDFFRGSEGHSSRLGTVLADRFSELLSSNSTGFQVIDRKILNDYLTKEWTTLEDLKSSEASFLIGREMGATGVILGTLYEENGHISLMIHIEGFGRPGKEKDEEEFEFANERIRFPVTEIIHNMLFQSGPNYVRAADQIPAEPNIFRPEDPGITPPGCIRCPDPDYSDPARAVKFQGNTILSIIVTPDGGVTSVYVLKGAPFGLTAKAIGVIQKWRLKPGQKDGKPVSVRLPVEITWRLN